MNQIVIYADGACSPNPGLGGYGVVIFYEVNKIKREFAKGFKNTTNNRMELLSVIDGLKEVVPTESRITIYTDSQYVCNGITKGWAKTWRDNKWHRSAAKLKANRIKNPDLWNELLEICEKYDVQFLWIRGHNENKYNERCDEMAVEARKSSDLSVDSNYENQVLLEQYYIEQEPKEKELDLFKLLGD